MAVKPEKVIDMGAGVPEPGSYEILMNQLKTVIKEADLVNIFSYSRIGDFHKFKDAAVKLMADGGYNTDPDTILFSSGGQNAITAVLMAIFKAGDKIGTDPHIYTGFKNSAAMLGMELVPIGQKNGEMDPIALEQACKNENLKGIYIIPEYHNPTACRMSLKGRKELARTARAHNLIIIEDAAYHMLGREPMEAAASFARENTIFIASLSKTMAPGLRLAFLSVPLQYKKNLAGVLYNMNLSISPLMAELAYKMIMSGEVKAIAESHRKNTILRNSMVNNYFKGYGCQGEDTCIFRWLKLPESITGEEFEKLALEKGVQVFAAERFTVGAAAAEKAVRLSVCAPREMEELEQALAILKQLLDDIGQ